MNEHIFCTKDTKSEGPIEIRKIRIGTIPFVAGESPEELKHRIAAAIHADEKEQAANKEKEVLKALSSIIAQHDGKGPCAEDFQPDEEEKSDDEDVSINAQIILHKMQEVSDACDELCAMMTVMLRDGGAGDNFPALLDVYTSIKNIQNEMDDNAVTVDLLAE